MSRVVFACFREALTGRECKEFREALRLVGARIGQTQFPRGVVVRESEKRIFAAVVSETVAVRAPEGAIALGYVEEVGDSWAKCGNSAPEGTYALLRWNAERVELVADAFATRTIWYFHDTQRLLASTSQRALVMLLQSFVPNAAVAPWMLTNGHIGPGLGWDERLARVGPRSIISLNRTTWSMAVKEVPLSLEAVDEPDDWHVREFRRVVEEGIKGLTLDTEGWLLPLSGGFDSRLLAKMLEGRSGVRTITWGCGADEKGGGGDARVARLLAEALGFQHRYASVMPAWKRWKETLRFFVEMSEGRTDNLLAYVDGFRLWSELTHQGVVGVIRGDEAFGGYGWAPVYSEREVRAGLGLMFGTEHRATAWFAEIDGFQQELPGKLKRVDNESLEDWRFRLYCEFRVPVALAALTETESAYVDAVKPLQYRRVFNAVCRAPTRLRTDKKLLIMLVQSIGPNIEFGNTRESDQLLDILRHESTVSFLKSELQPDRACSVLPESVLAGIIDRMPAGAEATTSVGWSWQLRKMEQWARAKMPHALKRRLKRFVPAAPLDPCLLAFRAWIIVRVHQVMREDAVVLSNIGLKAAGPDRPHV